MIPKMTPDEIASIVIRETGILIVFSWVPLRIGSIQREVGEAWLGSGYLQPVRVVRKATATEVERQLQIGKREFGISPERGSLFDYPYVVESD